MLICLLFDVSWSDDGSIMSFAEHHLHLDQFRHFAHRSVDLYVTVMMYW
jgi:hypothetical protein